MRVYCVSTYVGVEMLKTSSWTIYRHCAGGGDAALSGTLK